MNLPGKILIGFLLLLLAMPPQVYAQKKERKMLYPLSHRVNGKILLLHWYSILKKNIEIEKWYFEVWNEPDLGGLAW